MKHRNYIGGITMPNIKTREYSGSSTNIRREIKRFIILSSYLMGDITTDCAMELLDVRTSSGLNLVVSRFCVEFPEFKDTKKKVSSELSAYRYTIVKRYIDKKEIGKKEAVELCSFKSPTTFEAYIKNIRYNPKRVSRFIEENPAFENMTIDELRQYRTIIMEKAYKIPSVRYRIDYIPNSVIKENVQIGKHPEYIVLYIMEKIDKNKAYEESGYTNMDSFNRAIDILREALSKI